MNPGKLLQEIYDPEQFRLKGHQLVDLLADQLKASWEGVPPKVIPETQPEAAYQSWAADKEVSPDTDLLSYFRRVIDQSTLLHHKRYMGHQVAVPAPDAILADFLGAYLNNGMAVYEMGSAGSAIERVVIKHLGKQLGWNDDTDGVLTSGGTLANLTALLAARQLKASNDVWKNGTHQQFAMMVSEQAHYCVDRAVRIMGWGEKGMIKIPVDNEFRMQTALLPEYLEKAHNEGITVLGVVGSACTTSTGSYDPLAEIGRFCAEKNLWFHIDGAHGAAVMYTGKYRHLIDGIEYADSIVIDLHKMLMTPALTTALVFRDGSHSYKTFSQKADYLLEDQEVHEWHNIARRTIECTKYIMGVKFYTILRTYGMAAFDAYVTQLYDLASIFASMIQRRHGWELAIEPQANIVCFRLVIPDMDWESLNTLNRNIRQRATQIGHFYIVQTILDGRVYLRTTLMNPFTQKEDLESLLLHLEAIQQEFIQLPSR